MNSICVFCGASAGDNPVYRAAATEMGSLLGKSGLELVWGGGHVGLMGVVADAAVSASGHVWGVIPAFMEARELAYRIDPAAPGSAELLSVDSMHTRKAAMAARADAFVAMPGGFGTMDELFEILTWAQLGLHDKPVGLLNTQGFFNPLIAMVEHMRAEGFVKAQHADLIHIADTPQALLASLRTAFDARSKAPDA
ncbi:TIGR00730 family Rossman fold protein [Uliginosibacterium sp. H3]|uniref:Cytokinin riboside 5'-monophosphate phosphoribohydrolase n=1 Tax=Uliginosibacterium silvisoli TaxID=3114758 RepID=A0ABU6K9G2_9RHOO|nr:TIGR00730 family Rossman fold protein [Uliginosibacterium sp. H3]